MAREKKVKEVTPETKLGVKELYEKLEALDVEIAALGEQMKPLDEKRKLVIGLLQAEIPAGKIKLGVQHKTIERTSISWGKAAKEIIDTLVPKTKKAQVDGIVESFTTHPLVHIFIKEGLAKS
jgi:hypothetical protein